MNNIMRVLPFGVFIILVFVALRIIQHNTSPFEWIAQTFPNYKGIIGIIITLVLVATAIIISCLITRIFGKYVRVPIEKKIYPEKFSQKNDDIQLTTLINHHFCVKNSSPRDIAKNLNLAYVEDIVFDKNFDLGFLYNEKIDNYEKRFLLFGEINQWSYMMINVWNFDEIIEMAKSLSARLQTDVYYFFIDPWIFTCRWIIANKGHIIRAYYESHGQVIQEEGYLEIENSIIEKLKEEGDDFWEEKYWQLNQKICQPIDILNTKMEWNALKGELK